MMMQAKANEIEYKKLFNYISYFFILIKKNYN
jgi:hypothetical protein